MAITSARKTRLQNRITAKETYLASLYSMQENFDDVESYAFDSGEGRQQTKFRSLADVTREIQKLESQIDRLYRELQGLSIVNINIRRS